jgi:ethanolamine utilization protein EutA
MVQLVGLDFGTTTSSAVVADADLAHNAVTGKRDLGSVRERFRSELIFTPWQDGRLDVASIERAIDDWLRAGAVRREDLFGGGALLTGLAAQAENASVLVDAVRRRLGDAFIATADDPCLESWLAFHGSCAPLSRALPQTPILNLDIGGGTTNAALGLAGDVLATGCLLVGARHVQLRPGTYEITRLSRYAEAAFEYLGITKSVGGALTANEVDAMLDLQMGWLNALVSGRREPFDANVGKLHEQAPLRLPVELPPPVVAISGGVGELLYARVRGEPWPGTTAFGDLGIDLARRLLDASPWADDFRKHAPASCGRATVYGLLRHSTQVSGSTVFLADPDHLPLRDVPILGRINVRSSDEHSRNLLEMAQRSPRGGGLAVDLDDANTETLRGFAARVGQHLDALSFPPTQPLVLFTTRNLGKVLGQLITRWGQTQRRLVVVDEINVRNAQYAHLGALRDQVIPVSVFGLTESGASS